MHELSEEQEYVLSLLPNHIVMHAKAGAGKTTIGFACANRIFQQYRRSTLVLTFSALLKLNGRQLSADSPFIQVESFHSSVVAFFDTPCQNQRELEWFLTHPILPTAKGLHDLSNVGLLVIDEAQDLTDSTYALVELLRTFIPPDVILLIIGDCFQNVFSKLQQSSTKYLENPEKYFRVPFQTAHIGTSYRLHPEMAQWINTNLNFSTLARQYATEWSESKQSIWNNGLKGWDRKETTLPSFPRVTYHRFEFGKEDIPLPTLEFIQQFIQERGASSCVILVQSCHFGANHPANRIMNFVGPDARWLILTNDFKEEEAMFYNKGLVTTAWKFKGREKPLVIVCGFDESLEYHNRGGFLSYCLAYVLCTRASEHLIILSNKRCQRFFTQREGAQFIQNAVALSRKPSSQPLNVSELFRYLPFDASLDIIGTDVILRGSLTNGIECPTMAVVGGLCEPVAKWYDLCVRTCPMFQTCPTSQQWISLMQATLKDNEASALLMNCEWVDTGILTQLFLRCSRLWEWITVNAPMVVNNVTWNQRVQQKRYWGQVWGLTPRAHFFLFMSKFCMEHALEAVLISSLVHPQPNRSTPIYLFYPCTYEIHRAQVPDGHWFEDMVKRKELNDAN